MPKANPGVTGFDAAIWVKAFAVPLLLTSPPVRSLSEIGASSTGAVIVPSKEPFAISSKASSAMGSGVPVLPTGALGESTVRDSAPAIVKRNC